ncbi:cytochrome b-c1 complex subunit 8 [Pelodytes ibericus]
MGVHFGDLAKVRHVISYSLSPFEQRAFPSFVSKGIPNVWRRFSDQFLYVAPPFIIAYLSYTWANKKHKELKRKDPSLYENDK